MWGRKVLIMIDRTSYSAFHFIGEVIGATIKSGEYSNLGRDESWIEGYLQLNVGHTSNNSSSTDVGRMNKSYIRFLFAEKINHNESETYSFDLVDANNFENLIGKTVSVSGYIDIFTEDSHEITFQANSITIL